jgi:hypothetical protein
MQNHIKNFRSAAAIGLTLIALSACSASTDESSSEETENTTTEETVAAVVEETTTTESSLTSDSSTTVAPIVLMPNVVCMNLQAAQDEIQKSGVFFSRSDDATGMNRSQILDRNWIVVKQTPLPGQPVTELEAVLSAVKIGESTGGIC